MTDEQFKVCDLCGNTAGPGRNIKHNVDCPNHPDAIDDTPQDAGKPLEIGNRQRPVAVASSDEHRFLEPNRFAKCQSCGIARAEAPEKCDNRLFASDAALFEKLIAPPPAAPIGAKPISMAAARFDKAVHPEDLPARDALVAAMDFVDSCPLDDKPTHIIVLIGRDPVDFATASGTKFFQAGKYRHHAQMGLCLEAMHQIRESG